MGACCAVGARHDVEEINAVLLAGDGPWSACRGRSGVTEVQARQHMLYCLRFDGVRVQKSNHASPAGEPAREDGYVYFMQEDGGGPIKIGKSKEPKGRLRRLQTASHSRIRLLAVVQGYDMVEAQMHRRFAASRIRGEWFKPTHELLAFIEGIHAANVGQAGAFASAEVGRLREEKAELLDELWWHLEAEKIHGYSHKELVRLSMQLGAAERDAETCERLNAFDAEIAEALGEEDHHPPTERTPEPKPAKVELGAFMLALRAELASAAKEPG